jgi:endonuclease/exonuclease/phosphatase family metal-dependent hydrolase
MRVLTFNIHGWRTRDGRPNFAAVADLLAATQADLIGLNEVYYPRAVEGVDGPALEALAARLEMHYIFGPCLRWPAQDNLPADAYGNALLSRRPILAGAAHHLTPVPGLEQRGLLEARIALDDGLPFTAYVTHLDHKEESARLTQLRALRTWTVRDRNRPHLVMGDFNALAPWDYANRPEALTRLTRHAKGQNLVNAAQGGPQVVPQMEKAGYVDAFAQVGSPGAQSYLNITEPPIRIDYIFLSQALAPALVDCTIWTEPPGTEASDHRPVVAEFDLTRLVRP